MSPVPKISLSNPADAKAFFFALLSCMLFIVFLSAVLPRSVRKKRPSSTTHLTVPTPAPPTKFLESERTLGDVNDQYRVVPEHFKNVDFKNHSYRLNTSPFVGRLSDGQLELPEDRVSFSLQDVYYKDVTGDKKAEAIVRLSRVECGGSCDGGADLLYVYAMRNGKLTTLWQYETGTRAYGCALNSLTISDKQIVLGLFGECPKQAANYPGPGKFLVNDFTFILFEFNGRRFVQKTIEFARTGFPSDVKNYEPAIHLF